MALKRRFRCDVLGQAIPAENATGDEVFRGGSSEITKLSWRR
jgi:hypothetical protein